MRGLGKISNHLNAIRQNLTAANSGSGDVGLLKPVIDFGSNPGRLQCRIFMPHDKPQALVVVLHGCTQSASSYDEGSGWSRLAERHGFAVLFPQQQRINNSNLCFNWYEPHHARRGQGEALSISQMVRTVAERHGLNRSRVFITGLSAGGAMTAAMLACYPELFAAGAIIAGLPFATADTLPEALERMRGQGIPARGRLAALVNGAAKFGGAPPRLSVWHGTKDQIVHPKNADAIVEQWREMHGLAAEDGQVQRFSGHVRQSWSDSDGNPLIEKYSIRGMGHGIPLSFGESEPCGRPGPHMLEAGVCSTRQIAGSWGILRKESELQAVSTPRQVNTAKATPLDHANQSTDVAGVIENALRTAGLMR